MQELNWSGLSFDLFVEQIGQERQYFDGAAVYCLAHVTKRPVFIIFSGESDEECYVYLDPPEPTTKPPIFLGNWEMVHFSALVLIDGFVLSLPAPGSFVPLFADSHTPCRSRFGFSDADRRNEGQRFDVNC